MTTKVINSGWKADASSPLVATPPGRRLVSKDGRSLPRGPAPGLREAWSFAVHDLWGAWLALRWRWVIVAFCGSFLLHWLLFAVLWYLLAHGNGDLAVPDHDAPPPGHTLCVKHVTGFAAAFSFALETQLTIGYGTMFPNADCPAAIALLALQMLLGLMLEAFITGAFVAKFSRPVKRCEGVLFSPVALVCELDGLGPALTFRVCSVLHGRPLLDVSVNAVLYEERGDTHTLHQTALELGLDALGSRPCPLFLSPLTFVHRLTPDSPLSHALQAAGQSRFEPQPGGQSQFELQPAGNQSHFELQPNGQSHFELVVFLSASQEGTGSAYQKRTSYLADEIQFGRRFVTATGPLHHGNGRYAESERYFDTQPSSRDKECVVQINGDGSDRME